MSVQIVIGKILLSNRYRALPSFSVTDGGFPFLLHLFVFSLLLAISLISPWTKVIRYDDGPLKVLRKISDLKSYITQNSSPDVERKRQIRMALRALDGQRVTWPYDHLQVTSEMMPPSMS